MNQVCYFHWKNLHETTQFQETLFSIRVCSWETWSEGRENPFFFVFHDGTGSELHEIPETLSYGIFNTHTQWGYCNSTL